MGIGGWHHRYRYRRRQLGDGDATGGIGMPGSTGRRLVRITALIAAWARCQQHANENKTGAGGAGSNGGTGGWLTGDRSLPPYAAATPAANSFGGVMVLATARSVGGNGGAGYINTGLYSGLGDNSTAGG